MSSRYIQCERCEFSPGERIGNDYLVEKMLGAGTFGCVYKVTGNDGNICIETP